MGYDSRDMNAGEGKHATRPFVTVARVFLIVEIAAIAALAVYLYRLSILPIKYFGIGFAILAVIAAIQGIMIFGKQKGLGKSVISFILSLLLIGVSAFAIVFLLRTYTTLNKINETKNVTVVSQMDIYVRNDDPYQTLADLKGHTFGALELMDAQNTEIAIEQISSELGEEINVTKTVGILPLINSLKEGTVDAIIINTGYHDSLAATDDTFGTWARLLTSFDVERVVEDIASSGSSSSDAIVKPGTTAADASGQPAVTAAPVENVTYDPFIIYVQGMDTRGNQIVADVGNSDVNILMVVNPNTHKILLVNTPRDFYYYLWGDTNYPDKMTHTGYYGIDCGMTTLNSLYGININYYMKVGFNSVINIVDALGGVNVYSEYSFSQDGYSFTEGENYLDGTGALAFSRNRKSLPGGDRQRGKNQQAVIKAIIQKLTSSAILSNYSAVLEAITSNMVTNFAVEDINKLIQLQLDQNPSWDIQSIAVDGAGDWQYCYSLGSANDVLTPYWDTVEEAKAQIYAVLNGQ